MLRCCLFLVLFLGRAAAEPARIHVFVALADNATQGIQPVPAKIGNGDDPAGNLYWGCSEALKPVFKASADWRFRGATAGSKPNILERATFEHTSQRWTLVADAYRGAAIRECPADFFAALASSESVERFPLVAYIGHDGLMDFTLEPEATASRGPGRGAIVLCCKSAQFFMPHLRRIGAEPVLLTTQLMYPGAFVLRDTLAGWVRRENPAQIHARAAASYAHNQKLSRKAAAGVFTTSAP